MHKGAKGDNSMEQFGTFRNGNRFDKPFFQKWRAEIIETPPYGQKTQNQGTVDIRNGKISDKEYDRQQKEKNHSPKLNFNFSPELSKAYVAPICPFPSKRLKFHFRDLFPDETKSERLKGSQLFYRTPPKLIPAERLFQRLPSSVAWRYLNEQQLSFPVHDTKEDKGIESSSLSVSPARSIKTPRPIKEKHFQDAGCQTSHEIGIQTYPEESISQIENDHMQENQRELVFYIPKTHDVFTQTKVKELRKQKAKMKGNHSKNRHRHRTKNSDSHVCEKDSIHGD